MSINRPLKKEVVFASIITVIMSVMNISGLPAALFVNIEVLDIGPLYFSLMVNFLPTALIFFIGWKTFYPNWSFGLGGNGFITGIKKYGLSGILIFAVSSFTFCVGLYPFNYEPTILKVLIEGFIYYIGVAIIEELYIRGLLLNIIEKLFGKNKKATIYAIITSSVIFGMGHIFGILGSSLLSIIGKVVWTIGLGLYLGSIYKKTNNLWVPIALHAVIDFCAWPFCFSTTPPYPEVSLWILLITYLGVGGYGCYIMLNKKNPPLVFKVKGEQK